MKSVGYVQGVASPCIFVHSTRGSACSVHGDDFTSTGEKRALDWLGQQLESKYELRKGAIDVRKVKGDVNPADLFTKHLPCRDNIHQLVQLFGCEYKSGRSEAALLLRPQGSSGDKGGQPAIGHLPFFVVLPDGEEDHREPHGPSVLPHLHGQERSRQMIPCHHRAAAWAE